MKLIHFVVTVEILINMLQVLFTGNDRHVMAIVELCGHVEFKYRWESEFRVEHLVSVFDIERIYSSELNLFECYPVQMYTAVIESISDVFQSLGTGH